jgi:TonB family protein
VVALSRLRGFPQTVAVSFLLTILGAHPISGQPRSPVFDGASLDGWKVENTRATVKDGALTVRDGPGWVRHEQVFADFALTLEFRLGPSAKSIVYLRAWPTFDRRTSAPNNAHAVTMSGDVQTEPAIAPAQWRRLAIEAIGSRLRVYVDGVLVHAVDSLENPQGYIALSSDVGDAEFRAIEVRRMAKPRPTPVDGVYEPGRGVENPRLIKTVRPRYTEAALAARIQGDVTLSAVVLPDGTVGETQVLQSLDPKFGLDREAVAAASGFRFVPGMHNGQPVPVRVTIEISFNQRSQTIIR